MEIRCPDCKQAIPTEELNMEYLSAKCQPCNVLFNFGYQIKGKKSPLWKKHQNAKKVPKPKFINHEYEGDNLILSWKWFNGFILLFLGVFTFIWVLAVGEALSGPEAFSPFILVLIFASFFLLYYIICVCVNETAILVTNSELVFSHGPLPWFGHNVVTTKQIKQLYIKEKKRRVNRRMHRTYEVHVINRNGTHKRFISGLQSPEVAFYIEQEIEAYLNIKNRAVREAYG